MNRCKRTALSVQWMPLILRFISIIFAHIRWIYSEWAAAGLLLCSHVSEYYWYTLNLHTNRYKQPCFCVPLCVSYRSVAHSCPLTQNTSLSAASHFLFPADDTSSVTATDNHSRVGLVSRELPWGYTFLICSVVINVFLLQGSAFSWHTHLTFCMLVRNQRHRTTEIASLTLIQQ